ncbi:MAG: hypothetical protein HQK51_13925 [Oligoflexia bacterium]|nr:hypothetical protein [Oligoflexia bacterium]
MGKRALKTFYTLTLIKNRKDLYELLNISPSLSARYKFFGGGSNFSFEDEKVFHSDSITWVIIANSDFGRRGIKKPRINSFAKELLASSIQKFEESCGKEVILEERKMASIALMFTVSNISESNKKNIEASFKTNIGIINSFSLTSNVNYSKFYKYVEGVGKISIKFFAIGGRGLSDLAGFAVYDPYDLQSIQEALSYYMKGINKNTAAPVEYISSSYELFNIYGITNLSRFYQNLVLSEYFFKYMQIESEIKRIDQILNSKQLEVNLFSDLKKLYKERIDTLLFLAKSVEKCNSEIEECKLPEINIKIIDWSLYDNNDSNSNSNNSKIKLCEEGRNMALINGLISKREYDNFKDLGYGPVFSFTNFKGDIVGWVECKEYTSY